MILLHWWFNSNATLRALTSRILRHSLPVLNRAVLGAALLVSSSELLLREEGSADCIFLSPCAVGLATCSVASLGEERGFGGDLNALIVAGPISGVMPAGLHELNLNCE